MCISSRHLDFLVETTEAEYQGGRLSYETWVRLEDQAERCQICPLRDNGAQGDMLDECRVRLLRFHISTKNDDERYIEDLEKAAPA